MKRARGALYGATGESVGFAWHCEGCFMLNDPFEQELVRAGAAGGIFGLTAPGLCCRSDYPRVGEEGKAGVAPRSS